MVFLPDKAKEAAKKYDRSLVVVLTSIITLASTYFATTKYINQIVEGAHVISELKQSNAVQAEINKNIEARVDKIDGKIDRIYQFVVSKR